MAADAGRPADATVLLLKLTLVPLFLLAVTLVARRWGPRAAGLLGGLPLVTGPILGFVAVEQGPAFGAATAEGALAGVSCAVAFMVVYARRALLGGWPAALAAAWGTWLVVALALQLLPRGPLPALGVALVSLGLARRALPRPGPLPASRPVGASEVGVRMAAGAALTLAVTTAAAAMGPRWSGVLAVFPLLSTVVAADSHRRHSGAYAAALLAAMVDAMPAFAMFCGALALLLARGSTGLAFAAAVALALAVQAVALRRRR